MAKTFRSGSIQVTVSYERDSRLHRASPHGCYGVVVTEAKDVVNSRGVIDELQIGLPPRFAGGPEAPAALREIARVALAFSASDYVLAVERRADGMPELQ